MDVRNIMTLNVEAIAPDATIQKAARRMKTRYVHTLIVQDKDRILGTLSDWDIVLKVVAAGKEPTETRVRDAMARNRWFCFTDQKVVEAIGIMEKRRVNRLTVLDRGGKVVGVISAARAADAPTGEQDRLARRRIRRAGFVPLSD